MRKPFSLQKRFKEKLTKEEKTTAKSGFVYYVQFWLEEEGKYSNARSSGKTSRGAAESWAIEYLKGGQIVTRQNITVEEYTKHFFSEKSEYVRVSRSLNKQIGSAHLENQQAYVTNHINRLLGPKKIRTIDRITIERFRLSLLEDEFSVSTTNHVLLTLKIILEWAKRERLIQQVPKIDNIRGKGKERGIITDKELSKLFGLKTWSSYFLALNLLAYSTGMRLGECLALQRKFVDKKTGLIRVEHSWDRNKKCLVPTKNGDIRTVRIPSRVMKALDAHMTESAFQNPDDLVFHSKERQIPRDHKAVEKDLYKHFVEIGISEEERRERSLAFHSSRHFLNSLLLNGGIPMVKVKQLTGHRTDKMAEHYWHPDELQDVVALTERLLK